LSEVFLRMADVVLHLSSLEGETSVMLVDIIGDLCGFAARLGSEICRTKLASGNAKVEDQVCSRRIRVGALAGRTDSGHTHSKRPKIGH
jgi:hypothetical protein